MISGLLPSWVATEHTYEYSLGVPERLLFPAESARVTQAVPKRRHEFATVRHCARAALLRLGYAPGPLLSSSRGAPQWPVGVVGSMTHCDGFRAVAVARDDAASSLGIDAEPNLPLPEGLLARISHPGERAQLDRLMAFQPTTRWDRLLFSAKESVFKTWYPMTGRELDFDDATVAFDPEDGAFEATILVDDTPNEQLRTLHGRWAVDHGLIATAIALTVPESWCEPCHHQRSPGASSIRGRI